MRIGSFGESFALSFRQIERPVTLRICLALYLIWTIYCYWLDADLLWGTTGFIAKSTLFSPYLALGLMSIASISFLIGYRANVACTVNFLALLWLHAQNPNVVTIVDQLLRHVLFLFIFANSGLNRCYQRDRAKPIRGSFGGSWELRPLQILFSSVYLEDVIQKLRSPYWSSGDAFYYFSRLPQDLPWLPHSTFNHLLFIRLLSYLVLASEIAFSLLPWVLRFRVFIVAYGFVFYLVSGIGPDVPRLAPLLSWGLLLFWAQPEAKDWDSNDSSPDNS